MPTTLSPDQRQTATTPTSRFTGKRVHFIGIGGSGMNGLARVLLDSGAVITGSELKPNEQTFALTQRGVLISRDQMGELLGPQVDLVVRTAAVPDWNAEYKAALRYGIPTIKYSDLLGQVMAERFGVAVAGTHGKSTTTGMISYALLRCGADPSFVVGGTVAQLGGSGSRSGQGRSFVVEACEFDRSFHKLRPTVALILNVEEDHLDCYKDLDDIIGSFKNFAALVPAHDGLVIANGQDPNVARTLKEQGGRIEWVGLLDEREPSGSAAGRLTWVTRVLAMENGCYTGEVRRDGVVVANLKLSIPGRHNLFNATMAVAACHAAGVAPAKAAEAINTFTGVDRRQTEVGRCNGAIVVDDYGHHPTEIRATLKALREKYNPQRLFCVFQPHQHSRTRFLLEDFAASFVAATETIVPDIYFVRDSESERQRVSSGELVERIIDHGQQATHIANLSDVPAYLRNKLRDGDVVVTMGAGNVWEVGRELVAG
jgi:UDP-N-acetylmuramate--alanine ligase